MLIYKRKIIINVLLSVKPRLPSGSRSSRKAYSQVKHQYGVISAMNGGQNYTVISEFIYLVLVSPTRQLIS